MDVRVMVQLFVVIAEIFRFMGNETKIIIKKFQLTLELFKEVITQKISSLDHIFLYRF